MKPEVFERRWPSRAGFVGGDLRVLSLLASRPAAHRPAAPVDYSAGPGTRCVAARQRSLRAAYDSAPNEAYLNQPQSQNGNGRYPFENETRGTGYGPENGSQMQGRSQYGQPRYRDLGGYNGDQSFSRDDRQGYMNNSYASQGAGYSPAEGRAFPPPNDPYPPQNESQFGPRNYYDDSFDPGIAPQHYQTREQPYNMPFNQSAEILLVGNVGRDPALREGASQRGPWKLASFSLAVKGQLVPSWASTGAETEWFDITAWNVAADIAVERIRKGSRLVIKGLFTVASWKDARTGQTRRKPQVSVSYMEVIGRPTNETRDSEQFSPMQNTEVNRHQSPQMNQSSRSGNPEFRGLSPNQPAVSVGERIASQGPPTTRIPSRGIEQDGTPTMPVSRVSVPTEPAQEVKGEMAQSPGEATNTYAEGRATAEQTPSVPPTLNGNPAKSGPITGEYDDLQEYTPNVRPSTTAVISERGTAFDEELKEEEYSSPRKQFEYATDEDDVSQTSPGDGFESTPRPFGGGSLPRRGAYKEQTPF